MVGIVIVSHSRELADSIVEFTKMKAETGIEGRLLLVDDGSRDRTWELIEGFAAEHSNVAGVKLSHNEGHQNALWAGMQTKS